MTKWLVLDSSIIYNLKQRTFRSISKLPDALQAPAVCVHENKVYVGAKKNIYRYEENDWWKKAVDTEMTPSYLVSFKGYIYAAQSYFSYMYRFKPGQECLEHIVRFNHSPMAMCSLGNSLFVITGTADATTDLINVEEFQATRGLTINVLWTQSNWVFGINPAGSCAIVLTTPPMNPEVSTFHQRYLTMYGIG